MNNDIIFITNIGSRDVIVPSIPNLNKETRKLSEEKVLKDINSYKNEIQLPLILPSLKRITEKESINAIILFVTDQDPPHPLDTLFFGEIIKKILLSLDEFPSIIKEFKNEEEFKKFKLKLPSSKDYIRIEKLKKGVNDYDVMIHYYENYFKELEKFYKNKIKKEISKIYISITGGTPACNTGLLWSCIKIFREKVIPLYVKEGTSHAFELRVGDIILDSFKEEVKRNFISKKIFYGTEEFENKEVKKLLIKYIRERLNFNFDKAEEFLKKAEKNSDDEERDYITEQYKELKCIETDEGKINELYFNLKYKYEIGEYVDFLGRVYNFIENFLGYILKTIYDINVDEESNFKESIKCKQGLFEFLSKNNLRIERNLRVYKKILEFYKKEKFIEYTNKIEGLINKRNKTIIAHGYKGCSLEEIEKEAQEFFKKTEELLEEFKIKKEVNFIDKFLKLYNF